MESNHLNKPVYTDQKGKKKTIVKVMINTEQQRYKHEDVKKGLQNHKMLGRKVRKSRLFFLECV